MDLITTDNELNSELSFYSEQLAKATDKNKRKEILVEYTSSILYKEYSRILKKIIFNNDKSRKILFEFADQCSSEDFFKEFVDEVCFWVAVDNRFFYSGGRCRAAGIKDKWYRAFEAAMKIREYFMGCGN